MNIVWSEWKIEKGIEEYTFIFSIWIFILMLKVFPSPSFHSDIKLSNILLLFIKEQK